MDILMPTLAFGTLLAVTVFALFAQKRVLDRMDDPSARKSTLAADQNSHATPADA